MPRQVFHSVTADWFEAQFGQPTEVQRHAWPAIRRGQHTLIAAPTGAGKTLAAFMTAIDGLLREGLESGLTDKTRVLYVSPLKALSNDVQKNLSEPLTGIRARLKDLAMPDVEIRAWVRTGDTSQRERDRMRKTPPHIVVTTPESLYILLTSESGRRMLSTVESVIIDEIHALAGNKRGAHLALSLERLAALTTRPPVRIGLSATQKPIAAMADYLVGAREEPCTIIDIGHVRQRDIALELPGAPLAAVMANEVWELVYDRLAELAEAHRTTLVFVNTRRHAERVARHLAERLGDAAVTSHHGSLSREHRLAAEQKLKSGSLRVLVATASLELGIDIGHVDLVCQLGSPHAVNTFLQRVGRSGHALKAIPKGRLFPLSRDDLIECIALLEAVKRDELDLIRFCECPLDVLAQQIVAEIAAREWDEADLYQQLAHAWPYRNLAMQDYTAVLDMLASGFSTRRGRRSAYLHRDVVNCKLRARRGARLSAITNGGAIPDQFDYDVILSPEGLRIGTLNEDFAFESLPGDIFQLGNTSYRILKIEQGRVHVADARGQPPNIPFWFGEAPGRSDELSAAVADFRKSADCKLAKNADIQPWLQGELELAPAAAQQVSDYLATAKAAMGALPTQETIVLERFFDQVGDQHLVVHSPFGSRINRAWGLALRKRFCRKFNFELQAAALEDSIVLSLGVTHSFVLDEVSSYLHSYTVRDVLRQALLAAPMFGTHWRWNTNVSLAVRRNRNGKRVPAQFQRSDAEDLLAVIFPDQLACAENLAGGAIDIPDHPLVNQTVDDCLHEVMDISGLEQVLQRIESGEIRVITRDLTAPSPLAEEILGARPYAFLDDAPAEERRTLAVQSRGLLDLQAAEELGNLDRAAIERVKQEAWPEVRDADELHDALVLLGFMTEEEAHGKTATGKMQINDAIVQWRQLFDELCRTRRATTLTLKSGEMLWVAAERLAELRLIHPDAGIEPSIEPVVASRAIPADRKAALRELLRSRLEGVGPVTPASLAASLQVSSADVDAAMLELQQEGFAMQGCFSADQDEWCERRLLARIHRYTLNRLRAEIEPVPAADFLRFILRWQGLGSARAEGVASLTASLTQLEGISVPAAAWEADILPARIADYSPAMLDQLCMAGQLSWLRLTPRRASTDPDDNGTRRPGPVRNTPVALIPRTHVRYWRELMTPTGDVSVQLSSSAERLVEALRRQGATFLDDLVELAGLLRSQVEDGLAELTVLGLVTADSFAGLRSLIRPAQQRNASRSRRRYRQRRLLPGNLESAGRWSLVRNASADNDQEARSQAILHVAMVLLRRYGIVFRKLLEREAGLPPWRELLYAYRRLEARGEIRGGRFVAGFSGEQFALPEAIGALRECRKRSSHDELISLSAADPLNLTGVLTPDERIPALPGNRILYRDGLPVAVKTGGEICFLESASEDMQWQLRNRLLRTGNPASYMETPGSPTNPDS